MDMRRLFASLAEAVALLLFAVAAALGLCFTLFGPKDRVLIPSPAWPPRSRRTPSSRS